MLKHEQKPLFLTLPDSLVMKTVENEADVERLARFNALIHGEELYGMTRALILRHPDTRPHHWPYIEDAVSGEMVSSICYLPYTLNYGGVELPAAEYGIVGTREDFRGRGLVAKLTEYYKELFVEEGRILSLIQGIPYYYRQFGYSYAIPLENHIILPLYSIPEVKKNDLKLRKAEDADIPFLLEEYRRIAAGLDLFLERDAAILEFCLHSEDSGELESEFYIVEQEDRPAGYIKINLHGFSEGLILSECSFKDYPDMAPLLQLLKGLAEERKKPYLRLNLQESNPLSRLAFSLGAKNTFDYAWQLRFEPVVLLQRIIPVLNKRLQQSSFRRFSGIFLINSFKREIYFSIEQGEIAEVSEQGEKADLEGNVNPETLAALIFGWRTLEEISRVYPDTGFDAPSKDLLKVLFPPMESYIYWKY